MKLALFAICVSLISSAVSAAAIKFTFEATVTNSDVVTDGDPIELGDPVTAVFRYDTNGIDFVGGSTYEFRSVSFELSVGPAGTNVPTRETRDLNFHIWKQGFSFGEGHPAMKLFNTRKAAFVTVVAVGAAVAG